MTELKITIDSGMENTVSKIKIINIPNSGKLESLDIKDVTDLRLVFNNKLVRIQIKED